MAIRPAEVMPNNRANKTELNVSPFEVFVADASLVI